jgi:hypothetical protein
VDKKGVADALRSLAENEDARTEVAKLKDHLEAIEGALSAGVTRTLIYERLCQCGLKMTKGSFLNALRALLKGRNEPDQKIRKKTRSPAANKAPEISEKKEAAGEEDSSLTRRQRYEQEAAKYFAPEVMSPLTQRIVEKEKLRKQLMEKNDESSRD